MSISISKTTIGVILITFLLLSDGSWAWIVCDVSLPLTTKYSADVNKSIRESFHEMVDRNEFLERRQATKTTTNRNGVSCVVPILGGAKFSLEPSMPALSDKTSCPSSYVLNIRVQNDDDLLFLTTQLISLLEDFEDISTYPLRAAVADYQNSLPPFTGIIDSRYENNELMEKIIGRERLETLENHGFVAFDTNLLTTPSAHAKLSNMVGKTGHGKATRTDSVTFLNEEKAKDCGVQKQFEILMATTAYLNEYLNFENSEFEPLAPGTMERPLTNPIDIQAAEYAESEFYVEHSDNSLIRSENKPHTRKNYRCYTCILYCNAGWDYKNDGGSLRIYPGSSNVDARNVRAQCCEYVDINPANGRLLIFDSRLVHSVEKVTSRKKRLALTMWTYRPESSGAPGEVYDAGEAP